MASVQGRPVLGILATDAEWGELKALAASDPGSLTVPCCRKTAFPRVSPLGTRHFVHREHDPACPWRPEKPLELVAKAEVAHACHESGYAPTTDVRGADWEASVLAVREPPAGKPVSLAFQVRWRRTGMAEALAVQTRLARIIRE